MWTLVAVLIGLYSAVALFFWKVMYRHILEIERNRDLTSFRYFVAFTSFLGALAWPYLIYMVVVSNGVLGTRR